MKLSKLDPTDDLRHRPEPGKKMRDSLFWELVLGDEQLAFQIYLFLTDRNQVGYNFVVWGSGKEPLVMKRDVGIVDDAMDLDAFSFGPLSVKQPELMRTSDVAFHEGDVHLELHFEAIHDAFSYRSNPDGVPVWFAQNRLEQTGRMTGFLQVGARRIALDRVGHRDHSWGPRDWGVPHHWKWFVAYTKSRRVVNGWVWIAWGEWGFGGYVIKDGVTIPIATIDQHAEYHDDMTQKRLVATLHHVGGGSTKLTMDAFGSVKLPTDDKMNTVITEAGCTATIDGEAGAGQLETHFQADYLRYLAGRHDKR